MPEVIRFCVRVLINVLTRTRRGVAAATLALSLVQGLHYDPVELAMPGPDAPNVRTQFDVDDAVALAGALAMVQQHHDQHKFTDLAGFSLRCLTCNTPLKGQADARAHAQKTAHTNFGEV